MTNDQDCWVLKITIQGEEYTKYFTSFEELEKERLHLEQVHGKPFPKPTIEGIDDLGRKMEVQ